MELFLKLGETSRPFPLSCLTSNVHRSSSPDFDFENKLACSKSLSLLQPHISHLHILSPRYCQSPTQKCASLSTRWVFLPRTLLIIEFIISIHRQTWQRKHVADTQDSDNTSEGSKSTNRGKPSKTAPIMIRQWGLQKMEITLIWMIWWAPSLKDQRVAVWSKSRGSSLRLFALTPFYIYVYMIVRNIF